MFDGLTLFATLFLLSRFIAAKNDAARYVYLILDILVCILLYYTCLYLALHNDTMFNFPELTYLGGISYFQEIYEYSPQLAVHHLLPSLSFSSTVFFPTILYLTLVSTLLLAKTCNRIGKFITMQLLELGTTGDKSIFFYSGIFVGAIAGILKSTFDFIGTIVK